MGMNGFGLRESALSKLYKTTLGPVAFVDESLREASGRRERPFYTMSAVIIGRTQGADIRSELVDIESAGRPWNPEGHTARPYWHTAEAFKSAEGQRLIQQMTGFLKTAVHYNIVTVQTEIRANDLDMHCARDEALTALAKEVTRGSGDEAVRLIAVESRNNHYPMGDKEDADVIQRLRMAGALDRGVKVHHTSPSREPLLWAPDLSSWSFRRALAVNDAKWFQPLEEVSTVLHVNGTDVSVKRSNPHRPQHNPGVQPTVSHGPDRNRGRGSSVASTNSIAIGGSESEALSRIRRTAAAAAPDVDREILLATGTNDPRRLVLAVNEYFKSIHTGVGVSRPRTEEMIRRGSEAIMSPANANKLKEEMRLRRAATGAESLDNTSN